MQRGTGRPYYLQSKGLRPAGVYVRHGTSSDPATDTAIRKMIKETDGDCFGSMRSMEQQLSFEYAAKEFNRRKIDFDRAKMKSLGVISKDDMYSNTGLLISDQCPYTIKAAIFSGTDKKHFQGRKEFSGSLFKQLEELYTYLDLQNRTTAPFDGLYRFDSRDYPSEALREALVNSIVHRDYSLNADNLVGIYEDRIEFLSVGGLPEGIARDDIMLGLSVCRNEDLAKIFYRLKLIEAYVTGIPKIFDAYAQSERKPEIQISSNAFKITLPNMNFTRVIGRNDDDPKSRILDHLDEHGEITRPEADSLLDVSQAASNRLLSSMVKEGLLVKYGNGKRTKYTKSKGL